MTAQDASITLYGLKNCDTCRRARSWLQDKQTEFLFRDVRDDGLDRDLLRRWADQQEWQRLLNKKSLTWRTIPAEQKTDLDESRALDLLLEHPTLLKRPVLDIRNSVVVVGFVPAAYATALDM